MLTVRQMARESTVVCGFYSASWDFVCKVALSVRKKGQLGPYPVQYLAPGIFAITLIYFLRGAHQAHRSPQAKGWGLPGLLRLTRQYMATDPRDKVFALMGLVLDRESIGLEIDYRLSAEEVYLSMAVHSLEKLKDLELLANAGITSKPENSKLPSWVPDWTDRNGHRSNIASTASTKTVNRSASGESQPILSISSDRKILRIRGAVIDTITQLETSMLFGEGVYQLDSDSLRRESRWNVRCKACFESYVAFAEHAYRFPESQTGEEALWRTLCCDLTSAIPVERAPEEYGIGYKILRMSHEATQDDGQVDLASFHPRASSLFPGQWHQFTMFMSALGGYCRGRNLCITEGGYLGSVPCGTLIEDKICLLFGSRVPFVLRSCKDGYFELIGECYVHGIMDGELMHERDMDALGRDLEII